MIKIILPSIITFSSASFSERVFLLAENRQDPFTFLGRYGKDDPVRWELEFKERDLLLAHKAQQRGPLELMDLNGNIIQYPFLNRVGRRSSDQLNLLPRVSMTLDSDFSRQVRHAIFVPRGEQHFLIVNSQDPHKICPKESLEFLTVTPDNAMIATVSLHDPASGDLLSPIPARYHPTGLRISGDTQTTVPPYIFEHLRDEVVRNGCSAEALVKLPVVKFSINKMHVTKTPYENLFRYNKDNFQVHMTPTDYVEELDGGVCSLKINSHAARVAWGRNMLSKFIFVIDYNGSRYGICNIGAN